MLSMLYFDIFFSVSWLLGFYRMCEASLLTSNREFRNVVSKLSSHIVQKRKSQETVLIS